MRVLRRFFKRLSTTVTRRQDEERLREEFEEHLTLQTDENIRAGLPPVEARRQAVLKFGAVEACKEEYRDQQGLAFLETLLQDTRHSLRRLRNAPAFTVTTVLTLALGIGATTSIFTLAHAVLLKALPVANPGELFHLGRESRCCYVNGYSQEKEFSLVSYDLYKYFRDNAKGVSELAAFPAIQPMFGVRRQSPAEPARGYPGEFVSGNYFAMFGIGAYAGRALTAQDDQPGAAPVVMMSYRLWRQRYAADPSVIGDVFNLDDKPFTVVGITPPAFFGDTLRSTPPDFFLPLTSEPLTESDADLNKVNLHWLDLIGRLQPGAEPASVEAEMRVELKQWLRSHWGEMSAEDRANFANQTLFLSPGGAGITSMREQYEHWLRILMMVTAFVLLIVCANVANLMLVRGMERRRQTSLSMALGAGASRVVRQAFTESILLSLFGGAAGLMIAFAGTRLILRFAFPVAGGMAGIPISASPSIPVLLFAFGVSLLTGLAFGIAPAWMATRVDPIEALRGASRSTARTGSLPRKTMVVLQAALSLILLFTSGLLTTALRRLENQDLGIDLDRRLVAKIEPRLAGYRPEQLTPLYRRLHDSLSSVPGVSAVTLSTYSPQNGNQWGGLVWLDGHPAPGPKDFNAAFWTRVTGGYFDATGDPIIRGRGISEQDTSTSRNVAVINEAFARKFFKNEDPIGKHFGRNAEMTRQYEIVGIAKDIRNLTYNLDKPTDPFYFLPEAQHDISPGPGSKEISPGSHFLHDIVIVTRPGTILSIAEVGQAVAAADPKLPVISLQTLTERVAGNFTQQRLTARLTTLFGALALILASIGVYGVVAYNAGSRTNEIGVRMALGAGRSDAFALILRDALALISLGLLIGVPLALSTGRFLESQLYGINRDDPVSIAFSILILASSALIAAIIPAFRASSISPMEALRAD